MNSSNCNFVIQKIGKYIIPIFLFAKLFIILKNPLSFFSININISHISILFLDGIILIYLIKINN